MLRSTMTCVLLAVGAACVAGRAEAQTERRCRWGETQVDLNRCAEDDAQAADVALDRAYRAALRRLDPAKREPLRRVQRAWLRYRDLECDFVTSLYEGGSMQPDQRYSCFASVTRARTAQLRLDVSELLGSLAPPSGGGRTEL